ncbi:cAMP-dependent protein kinase regulatory subunit [Saccharomycopsis crataegensis]|uniref:cAMP-dependent protein kinase regulatory subunit n=1 Tax=Saccharomycopsis crataegensis TaxID=43959 RepID=A0AAV5QI04_9ASCO|nr:cAMP-dependent protein kinase regulatory subunit [Saccharomycopsis crataegensis]
MSLPSEYIEELNTLNKKISQDQPKDVLEYCAAYFSNRLAQKRGHSLMAGNSSSKQDAEAFSFQKVSFASNDSQDPHASYVTDDDPVSTVSHPFNHDHQTIFKNSFGLSSCTTDTAADAHHNLPPPNFMPLRRSSVSAEALNPKSFENDDWKPPYHELTAEQLSRLNKSIVKNFLFSNLEDDAMNTVLHALQEQSFARGSTVIQQGDEGEFFYLIEKGEVDFFVDGNHVASGGPGSSFGELALMYHAPRAATVKAKTALIVWALDRLTFRRILLEVTARKRLMYEEFLKDVTILAGLSSYQRSKLADALHTEVYKTGDVIIKQGDVGENFYLIEQGEAEILKDSKGVIGSISKGDYFGEIALLNDLPRQATIKAKTQVKVATLGKSGFQRLLGPVVEVLKAQDPRKQEQ